MRLIIAGSRSLAGKVTIKQLLHAIINIEGQLGYRFDTIVSGTASGIDELGEQLAMENQLNLIRFRPDWEKYGKAAGPIRNRAMAKSAHALLLIWDGKSPGSANMLEEAKKAGIPSYVIHANLVKIDDLEGGESIPTEPSNN